GRGRTAIALDVGQVYAANTVGSITGALLGGFVLLPVLTAPVAWRVVALAMAALAIGIAAQRWREWRRMIAPGLLVAIAIVECFATGPTAVWRHSAIGAGRGTLDLTSRNALDATLEV